MAGVMAALTAAGCGAGGADTAPPEAGGTGGAPNVGVGGTGDVTLVDDAGTGELCDAVPPPAGCLVAAKPACGDGTLHPDLGEACDDGNARPGDGCSGVCQVEPHFACPTSGEPCVSTIVCGDGTRGPGEICDDGNEESGDGCAANCRAVETGYECLVPGDACKLKELCGDGRVMGGELCDDGNATGGDGCTGSCAWEPGWGCAGTPPNYICFPTVCGDGTKGNAESCDDGNRLGGDGCSPDCKVEPDCSGGACTTTCGDGLLLPGSGEVCDDGNTKSGDGCAPDCSGTEAGFNCTQPQPGASMTVPVVYRDFTDAHADFEVSPTGDGIVAGSVAAALNARGKPTLAASVTADAKITSAATFAEWFDDSASSIAVYGRTLTLCETAAGSGAYVNRNDGCTQFRSGSGALLDGDPAFFPIDDAGWVALGQETLRAAKVPGYYDGSWPNAGNHNFYFTSEVRFWFEYQGGHALTFVGDDDVWVFVNRELAADIGGVHSPQTQTVTLDSASAADFGLVLGKVYEIVVFQAERHVEASSYRLTLSGFAAEPTQCLSDCGDGIVAPGEECDPGLVGTGYGGCNAGSCTLGPYCGDGFPDAGYEACDDGLLSGAYGECAPGCVLGPTCGDGVTQPEFEDCDDGVFSGLYGQCAVGCRLSGHCGDGEVNGPEQCDDGNAVDHDGCSAACVDEVEVR